MRVYCRYSGVTFKVAFNTANAEQRDCFKDLQVVAGQHPIFSLPVDILLSRAGEWAAGSLNALERKLLFLALLKSTDMVVWDRVPAQPSEATVQKYMHKMMVVVQWFHHARLAKELHLPKFSLNHDTKELKDVGNWLEVWQNADKEFRQRFKGREHLDQLRLREAALERMIKSNLKRPANYLDTLARWAMDAAEVSVDATTLIEVEEKDPLDAKKKKLVTKEISLRDAWIELFKIKDLELYNTKTIFIEELLEYMEANLKVSLLEAPIHAYEVLSHLRHQLHMNKNGMLISLGVLPKYDILEDEADIITDNDVGKHNIELIKQNAPAVLPQRSDYPEGTIGNLQFLRAKAAWNLKTLPPTATKK